jgi:uncharacterized protein (TIGR01777 family)
MKVLVSGASGLIGSALAQSLVAAGHAALRLVRQPTSAGDEVAWDPAAGALDAARLEGLDAVVHLAGENIAQGRWTATKKGRILASRAGGTRLLAAALAQLTTPPRCFGSASAIGYYGNRPDEDVDEASEPGSGFLADVCRQWEAAAEPAAAAGIRTVLLRFGVVLDPAGGALATMLPLFRWGLGGRLGNGRQWVSWISRSDAVAAIMHVLGDDALRGPANLVAPQPVTAGELAAALGRVLRRPAVLHVPAFALRLLAGEMADEMLLAGVRAVPRRLRESGFAFRDPQLEPALRHMLGSIP